MAIALVGLSWFQLYWINSAIELSRERFEKDALESMITVVQKLERNEMAVVATNSFAFFGSSTELHDTSEIVVDYRLSVESDTINEKVWFKSNDNQIVKLVIVGDSSNEIHE
ncbi:MAG: hypothetical protein DRI71_04200, partial [Bacteroidetes bacterium]